MFDFLNKVLCEDCNDLMDKLPDNCIDLVVTSPPYDKLRIYNGYSFDLLRTVKNLFRILKPGGTVVWVIADETKKGTESGSSFRQALLFMDCGFNLHDTMIWDKKHVFGTAGNPPVRYQQAFEYIFVFTKGRIKTFNPITAECIQKDKVYSGTTRRNRRSRVKTDCLTIKSNIVNKGIKIVNNIFTYEVGFNKTSKYKSAFKHPAVFPDKLAYDNIITWSNPLDIVFDPFGGSGTTSEQAKLLGRYYITCDISQDYVNDIEERLSKTESVIELLRKPI